MFLKRSLRSSPSLGPALRKRAKELDEEPSKQAEPEKAEAARKTDDKVFDAENPLSLEERKQIEGAVVEMAQDITGGTGDVAVSGLWRTPLIDDLGHILGKYGIFVVAGIALLVLASVGRRCCGSSTRGKLQ